MTLVALGVLAPILLVSAPADTVPLYDNLGTYHRAISTSIPQAQQYFDQGIRLVYGFNHGEAIRAFTQAARLDPNCAICHWGAALAYGPHVNAGMDSAAGVAAYAHLQQARKALPHASPVERAFIEALTARYAAVPPADRAPLDSAYASAMATVVERYPDDIDAATLYAESLMDLRPWNYWKPDGTPYPGTEIAVSQLEGVLRRNPDHPGACHYYIHAVEAVTPDKALPCAERLAALMPGVGHMVHMPGHIYIRVGRYNDAIDANVHAVHEDEQYIAEARPEGVYPLAYYPHNYHFLSFASTMAGRSAQAIEAARTLVSKVPLDAARQVQELEAWLPFAHLTLVTFGRWEDVLREPPPPADLRFATAMTHYARGVAFAATEHWDEAQAALDSVKQIMTTSGTDRPNTSVTAREGTKRLLGIATHALTGEIALRRGDAAAAIPHFQQAIELEDGVLYIEPPSWYYPVRHSLGVALLKAGRAAEAERIYREDLKRFPENGWSLRGLAASLRAQGKTSELATVEQQFQRAWGKADVKLAASRF